jgi:hypothetical protein
MRRTVVILLAILAGVLLPARLLRGGAHDWVDPRAQTGPRLARAVDDKLRADLEMADFGTGSAHFDGEWWLASYAFALVGYANVADQHPELRDELAEAARHAAAQLVRTEVRAFDTRLWGDDMMACLDQDTHDHAVLGYVAMGLGAARRLDPDLPQADLHDRIVAALTRRVAGRERGLLATYPRQAFPVDVAVGYGAIAEHAALHGRAVPPALTRRITAWERDFVTEDDLLVQMVRPSDGRALDAPRGSGTALAAWALAPADPRVAARLAGGARDTLGDTFLGLGVIREYREGGGMGDVDSGPLVFGYSISGTGFALGAARRVGDRRWFARLWSTTRLFGVPWGDAGFLTGGTLGNALMLAFLTTPEPEELL